MQIYKTEAHLLRKIISGKRKILFDGYAEYIGIAGHLFVTDSSVEFYGYTNHKNIRIFPDIIENVFLYKNRIELITEKKNYKFKVSFPALWKGYVDYIVSVEVKK